MFAWISYCSPFLPTNRHVSSSREAEQIWNLSWSFVKVDSRSLMSRFKLAKQAIDEKCEGLPEISLTKTFRKQSWSVRLTRRMRKVVALSPMSWTWCGWKILKKLGCVKKLKRLIWIFLFAISCFEDMDKSNHFWNWRKRNNFDIVLFCILSLQRVVVAEWLRRWTRNPLGSSRTGSNPVGDA